jgi:hypothetical protein
MVKAGLLESQCPGMRHAIHEESLSNGSRDPMKSEYLCSDSKDDFVRYSPEGKLPETFRNDQKQGHE